ncbi:MAG TPA: asparagine synthase-related protein [Candidatus Angelobacter sp.]|nr:asparagine synthase-related protein [Candidatus Angelobacter sp.]
MNTHAQQLNWLDRSDDRHQRTEILAWDGRLDNRNDLLLRLANSLPGDTSNAALARAAYEHWGTDGFVHLIGDWSLVLHDHANRTIVMASDFAGVRPLFYCVQPGRVLWSSRLQSVVDTTGISELDEQYAHAFLLFGGCPNRTPYKGIYSVPPGHAVCVSSNQTRVHRFWSMPTGDEICYRDGRLYAEHLRRLFREAVSVRLQNESPVLAELSGGLDSSSVVSMASHLMRSGMARATRLTSVSFVWRNSLDEPFIREMESFCGIEGVHISTHAVPIIAERQVGNAMPAAFQPLRASVAAVANTSGATAVLTGQNGDLMMGNWFDDSLQVAASLSRFRFGRACKEALAWSKILRLPVYRILWRAAQAALPPTLTPAAIYTGPDGSYTPKNTETSLAPGLKDRMGADTLFSNAWMQAPPERRRYFHALSLMLELRMLQPPEPLQHLEYTHPFAHRPLVEFLMAVPPDVLCRPGEPRRLMRSALSDLWPIKLRTRRSKGVFSAPWQEALRPLARTLLKAGQLHLVERGFVDRTGVLSRLERLCAGLDCNEHQLRNIILLELWLRNRAHADRVGIELQAA